MAVGESEREDTEEGSSEGGQKSGELNISVLH